MDQLYLCNEASVDRHSEISEARIKRYRTLRVKVKLRRMPELMPICSIYGT